MKKVLAVLMAAVLCAAALTACGKEASNGAQTVSPTDSKSTEEGAAESKEDGQTEDGAAENAAKDTDKEVLIVGTNAEFPPFEYVGDDGEPDGFDVALIRAIGEKMGMDVQVENMEFASLVAAIGSKIDASIAGMTVTEERQAVVDFSDSYYEAVQSVIVLADSDIAKAAEDKKISLADLENKTIGVQMATTGNIIADEISGATVQAYNKGVDAVNDLINGRVDLVIIDTNPAEVFAEKFEGQIVALDGSLFAFEPEYYAIALPKGSELVEKVNKALEELKADGTFDALVAEYIEAAE